MATNQSLLYKPYYEITSPVASGKFRSRSSDSLLNNNLKNECEHKHTHRKLKIKKSHTAVIDFQTTPIQSTPHTTTPALRRRFSLFRPKRSQQSDENFNIYTLQQDIGQLKHDLQIKTNELEGMKVYIENKRCSMIQSPNESIEQAMHMQLMLNTKVEEMIIENDLLKRSLQELELFAQQQKCK